MQQLLYADEVRSIKDVDVPKTEVKDAELKLAQQLIEQQTPTSSTPAAYVDEVRARIEAAIQKKVEGQEITMAEAPQEAAQVIDLMEALRASLEKKPAKKAAETKAPKPQARKSRQEVDDATLRGAGGREAPAPAAQDDSLAGQSRASSRPRGSPPSPYLFSFQDLIVLRTAQALATAKVPARRIASSLRELRRHLPDAMPLSGLSIGAVGDRVVVKEGASAGRRTRASICSRSKATLPARCGLSNPTPPPRSAWKTISIEAICCTSRAS